MINCLRKAPTFYIMNFSFVLTDDLDLFSEQILEKPSAMFMNNHSTAIEKAKTYYKLCMDETRIEKQGVDPIIKVCRL